MRILVLAIGPHAGTVVKHIRDLGYEAVVMAGDPDAGALRVADAGEVGNVLDWREVVRVARARSVDGIFPPPEPAVISVAQAVTELGLPGMGADAAARTRDKWAMRRAFEGGGIPNPQCMAVHTAAEATGAARAIGLPVIVKPADSFGSIAVRRVDHIEDVPLAFSQAVRSSFLNIVLVEAVMEGEERCVEGVVLDGEFSAHAIVDRERSGPPFYFDEAVYAPPALTGAERGRLVDSVSAGARALGIRCGYVQADVIVSNDGPRIVEVAAYPSSARMPADVTALAGGPDSVAAAAAMATGQRPPAACACQRGAAVAWLSSRSGVVTEVRGVEAARGCPGVVDVVVNVAVGDVLGHAVDCPTRDRVGYVIATGDTAAAALSAAQGARGLCEIITTPAYR